MRIGQKAVMIATAFLCASCSIYKEYERPENVLPDNLYGDIQENSLVAIADSIGIEALNWKDFFIDPKLQALIELGLQNNADLQIAALRITRAEAGLNIAKLSFLPFLSVNPHWNMENSERLSGTAHAYSIAPSASWEVDFRGSLQNQKRYAEASLEQAEVYEQSVRTELIATIAQGYYTLLMLDAQKAISSHTFENWKENVRIMKAMKDAGMANEASVSQTEANCHSIEASLYDLDNRILQAENALALVLGTTPTHFERGTLHKGDLPTELLAGVPSLLLARRPDVRMAELELRKAYYNTCAARADFYPSVTLSGDYGWEKALTSPASWVLGLAANAAAPVFNHGRNRNNLKIAKAAQEEALINFRQAILKAGNEVNSAIAQCNLAGSKTDIRIRQIEALQRAVESTRQLMSHSESTYLEVLTAQQSLLSAQLQQASDHFEAVMGVISLYRALGGGA